MSDTDTGAMRDKGGRGQAGAPGEPGHLLLLTGVAIGLILIFASFFILIGPALFGDGKPWLAEQGVVYLMICVGLALITTTYGAQTSIGIVKGLSISGSIAGACLLYALLVPQVVCDIGLRSNCAPATALPVPERVVRGSLTGEFDMEKLRGIRMESNEEILGTLLMRSRRIAGYRFQINEQNLSPKYSECITVILMEQVLDKEFHIPVSIIVNHSNLHREVPKALQMEYVGGEIRIPDGLQGDIRRVPSSRSCLLSVPRDDPVEAGSGAPPRSGALWPLPGLIGAAWAQDGGADGALPALLEGLEAGSPLLQDTARIRIGRLGAAALPALVAWHGRDPSDPHRTRQFVLTVGEIAGEGPEAAAAIAASGPDLRRALLAPLTGPDAGLRSRTTQLLYEIATPDWIGDILEVAETGEAAREGAEVIILGTYDRADEAGRDTIRAAIADAGSLSAMLAITGSVMASAEDPVDADKGLGWSYYGSRPAYAPDAAWSERNFDATGRVDKDPAPGDRITAKVKVHLREGMVEYVGGVGWVNKPSVGVTRPREAFTVLEVREAVPGFWWVRLGKPG